MAFNRFISRISKGEPIEVYGRGDQSRDFTHVSDIVDGTILAMKARPGRVYNLGFGASIPLLEAIKQIEAILGKRARVNHVGSAPGDVKRTSADASRAKKELGFRPRVRLSDGLRSQVAWQLHNRKL